MRVVIAVGLLSAALAFAQTPPPPPPPPPPPMPAPEPAPGPDYPPAYAPQPGQQQFQVAPAQLPPTQPEDPGMRVHGFIGGMVAGGADSRQGSFGLGLSANLGIQFNDLIALYGALRTSTIIFATLGQLAAMVEFSPGDSISLAIGAGGYLFNDNLPARQLIGVGVQLPFSVAFNIPGRQRDTGVRRGFRLSLDSAFLVRPESTNTAGFSFGLSFGAVWR